MEAKIYFKQEYEKGKIGTIDELILKFNKKEFKSPFRSTIPLLALYKSQPNICFRLVENNNETNAKYIFEFETPVSKGKGRSSCTDLMIEYSNHCIAIEAKWTEPAYIRVIDWLKDSANKEEVLKGWIEMISNHTGVNFDSESIHGLPYQLIHRVASACFLSKKDTHVVYLGFDLSNSKEKYYIENLKAFSEILEDKINFYLARFKIDKLAVQTRLETSWKKDGNRDLSKDIIQGLKDNSLMSVSQLTVEKINEFSSLDGLLTK